MKNVAYMSRPNKHMHKRRFGKMSGTSIFPYSYKYIFVTVSILLACLVFLMHFLCIHQWYIGGVEKINCLPNKNVQFLKFRLENYAHLLSAITTPLQDVSISARVRRNARQPSLLLFFLFCAIRSALRWRMRSLK